MKAIESRLLITGVLLALTLGSGIWLSRAGRPYNTGIFTLHKLIALAAVVLAVLTVRQVSAGAGLPAPAGAVLILTALLAVVLFATGAMLSIGKPDLAAIRAIHRLTPILITLSAAAGTALMTGVPA